MGFPVNGSASADTDAIFTPIRTANAFEQTVERIGRAIKMGLQIGRAHV